MPNNGDDNALSSKYALYLFKMYTHENDDSFFVITSENASKFVFKEHNYVHTCSIKTQPTNTNHKVCLGFTHSNFLCSREKVQTLTLTPMLQTI